MSKEETIRKKLKVIEDTRRNKEKERDISYGIIQGVQATKLNATQKAFMALVEMMLKENAWADDNIFAIWQEELKTELRLIQLEKTVEKLKQELEWREENR